MATPREDREFDVVLFGATGFTGTLVMQYLFKTYGAGGELKWAIAGRSQGKLEARRAGIPGIDDVEKVPILLADSGNQEQLQAVARRTRVICSTVGPFLRLGTPLVRACVAEATDYCDITGETPWTRQLIDELQQTAFDRGVHITPSCGFDSVPADLGTLMMAREAGEPLKYCKAIVQVDGGASGGTLHTMLNLIESLPVKQVQDPFLLNPPDCREGLSLKAPGAKDQSDWRYDDEAKTWTCPFVMAGCNTRVVRRSLALYAKNDRAYGPEGFYYNEAEQCASKSAALLKTLGLGFFMLLVLFPLTRWLLAKVLPAPGTGPSAEKRAKSSFSYNLFGETVSGRKVRGVFAGGDPGYSETAKMLAETAICLATQKDQLPLQGGILTPASACGELLIERLRNRGMTLQVHQ